MAKLTAIETELLDQLREAHNQSLNMTAADPVKALALLDSAIVPILLKHEQQNGR